MKTQFNSFELNESEDGDAIQSYLAEKTGQKTVPMIFIGQHFVGGSDDLGRLAASNELKKMLKL